MTRESLFDRVDRLCAEASVATDVGPLAAQLRERLRGPLRVAIAGRIKAGKSTLLNALVGQRIAPTDAGECTRYVTWYRDGANYRVSARTVDGRFTGLPFERTENALVPDIRTVQGGEFDLDIEWPSARLRDVTLIDTPGFDSSTPETGERSHRLFAGTEHGIPQIDAVLYLMRQVHPADIAFMEVFRETGLTGSPITAAGVLSRADEVGGGGPGALAAANRLAARYAAEPRLRASVSTVVPVSGLLAETAATLTEQEAGWLRQLAREPVPSRSMMLLSLTRFVEAPESALTPEIRRHLALRFGLYGLRWAMTVFESDQDARAVQLAEAMASVSGIETLRDVLNRRFLSRSRTLIARSVLAALRQAAAQMLQDGESAGARLHLEVERIEGSAHEMAELELLDYAIRGGPGLSETDELEIEHLVQDTPVLARLGLSPGASLAEARAAALSGAARWRERSEDPFLGREFGSMCDIAARSYEGLYAEVSAAP